MLKSNDLDIIISKDTPPPDWSSISFGTTFSPHMLQTMESLKAYRSPGDGKIRLFRGMDKMHKLNTAAARLGLPHFESQELLKCIVSLIRVDEGWVPPADKGTLYLRPMLIATTPTFLHHTPRSALLYVLTSPTTSYFNIHKGVRLYADPSFARAWPGGVADHKMGCVFAPTLQVANNAKQQGWDQILWLYGENEEVTEAGTMNICLVKEMEGRGKELVTPPTNHQLIYPGVMRESIITLIKETEMCSVSERRISMGEVMKECREGRVQEMFGCGTACSICPVTALHYSPTGETVEVPSLPKDGEKKIWQKLLQLISDIQFGINSAHPEWITDIPLYINSIYVL